MNLDRLSPSALKRLQIGAACLSLVPLAALLIYFGAHTVNLPWGEGYFYTQNIVVPAYDGTLTPGMLFIQYLDHRNVVSNLLIAANTLATRWDVRVQSIITIVEMVLVVVFAVLAFRAEDRRAAWFATIPFSMLFLEINFQSTWLRQYNDTVFPFVFISIALWAIRAWPAGWKTLLFAALMAVLSSFSTLIGTAAWAVLPIAMLLVGGYRKPKFVIAWAVMAALCGAGFLIGYQVSSYTDLGGTLLDKILFDLVLLGAAFSRDVAIACVIGVLGGVIAAINLAALRRHPDFQRLVAVWVTMLAFALIAAFMTTVGRGGYGPAYAVNAPHFFRISSYWWAAAIALMLLVLLMLPAAPRWLRWGDIVVIAVLVPLYIQVNIQAANTWIVFDGRQPIGPTPADEQCAWHFAMTGDTGCMTWGYFFNKPRSNQLILLAQRRLTTFAHDNPAYSAALPQGYQPGDPVIVDAPLAVQHVAILQPGGEPVPPASLIQLVQPGQEILLTDQSGPAFSAGAADLDAIRAKLAGSLRIWLMRLGKPTPTGDALVASLSADHLSLPQTSFETSPYPDFELVVPKQPAGFSPQPIDAQAGGAITLASAAVTGPDWKPLTQAAPGGLFLVTLRWQVDHKVSADYSLFIHVEDGSGKLVAQFDGQYETSTWTPVDPHDLTVPLALPSGAQGPFKLFVGFYNVADNQRLPITWPGHALTDNRILISDLPQ